MNSSDLFSSGSPILDQVESRTPIRPGEGTMSTTIFITFCILGLDFMIYAFFRWTFGDKRDKLARELAARRNALQQPSPRPFLLATRKAALGGGRVTKSEQKGPEPHGSYKEQVA
jgi:hypothetical protein